MPSIRHLLDALRVAALCLLVVSVCFGPGGLGGSAAFASANTPCGVSCPCDEAGHDDHENEQKDDHADADPCDDDVGADPEHGDDGDPCKDECPDDCPNCGCSLGVAMAVLPLPVISRSVGHSSARMLAPVDVPGSGACTAVFRPPRLLA